MVNPIFSPNPQPRKNQKSEKSGSDTVLLFLPTAFWLDLGPYLVADPNFFFKGARKWCLTPFFRRFFPFFSAPIFRDAGLQGNIEPERLDD